ncbi:MAG: sensor histidine kinase [Saprospiraceae bacterium]
MTDIPAFINNTGVFDFHSAIYHNDDGVFYILFYISLAFFLLEIALNLRTNWTYEFKFIKRIKKLTLEQTLLILLGFFSGFLSLIELSSNGQGINSFSELPMFFVKWLSITVQLFTIMFNYYLFYWINHYILINKILKQKGVVVYILSFMFVVLIGYPIASQMAWWITSFRYFGMPPIIAQGAFDGMFFIFPFIEMLVSIPFILAIQWFKQGGEIATLEKEKSEAELTLLKQQINPHFFFNTLNNLYALSLKKDEATPEVILQLSELMRYVIYKGKEESVKLEEEINYIEDYCELQQIRLHKNLDFRFTQNVEDETIKIPPLLFIILVENAFKHGIEPAENTCYLHLNLESDQNGLTFTCENSYEDENDKPKGIGLDNLRKRLALRYPNQYSLEIIDDENIYKTILKLF